MSIRDRLRSTSVSVDKQSDVSSCQSNENGFCEICEKKDGKVMLTCSICATQYHRTCLGIKSSLLLDPDSWYFQDWSCKQCARCYYCRKRKVRRSSTTQSLITEFNESMKLKSNDIVSCKLCNASIHAFCLYRMKREKKRSEVSKRDFMAEKNNHTCNACDGVDSQSRNVNYDEIEEEDGDEEDEDEEEDEEESDKFHSELSDLDDEENAQRQIKLKNHLKKLGIINVEEHLKQSLNEERTLRRSMSKRPLSFVLNDSSPLLKQKFKEPKRKKRKQSELEVHSRRKMPKWKTRVKFDAQDDADADEENGETCKVQSNKRCSVTDCNSSGHLSGQYKSHRNLETCPLFHNQTNEQCVQRHHQMTARHSTKTSPSKNRKSMSPSKSQALEKNPAWMSIMEARRQECNANNNFNDATITDITSNRQPSLEGFTPSFDLEMFRNAESRNAELIHLNSVLELAGSDGEDENEESKQSSSVSNAKGKSIIFGKHEIDVWYGSPYSDDFQNCLRLFICEYCLKCINLQVVYHRHINKCTMRHPPGDEIYRKGDISFFEIDGNKHKEYCQNLCMMAKLFLEHKTLLFDVETFLFYVMTFNDNDGMHIVGYFSKEKYSVQGYNVSCILTLPHYQRTGYGRMLIDFSYLLTKSEKKVGSPERPLSDLGLLSYRSYWKFIIKDYLSTYAKKDINIKEMSMATGVSAIDLVTTLQLMTIIKYWKGCHIIILDKATRNRFIADVKQKKKRYGDKMIDPKCLVWTPNSWLTARPKTTSC